MYMGVGVEMVSVRRPGGWLRRVNWPASTKTAVECPLNHAPHDVCWARCLYSRVQPLLHGQGI